VGLPHRKYIANRRGLKRAVVPTQIAFKRNPCSALTSMMPSAWYSLLD
jgi:hypothetical protein